MHFYKVLLFDFNSSVPYICHFASEILSQFHHHHAQYVSSMIRLIRHIGNMAVDLPPPEHVHQRFKIFGFCE